MRTTLVLAFSTLVACAPDSTKDTGTGAVPTDGGGPTGAPVCDATIVAIAPADGAVVPVDTAVVASFDLPITPTDDFAMAVSGATGTVTLADDGLSMTWAGTLSADTEYTVSASVCTSEVQSSFRTGPDPVDLTSLAGQTYVLPWSTVEIVDPAKGYLLELEIDYLLAQIVTVDPLTSTATAVGTMGYATMVGTDVVGSPEPECATLGDNQVADFGQNPIFSISGDFDFVIAPETGAVATLEAFSLEGVMVDGGLTIRDPHMTGMLATESISLLGLRDCFDPLVQLFGVTCVPCTTSPAGYCMWIEATAPAATVDPSVDIVGTCVP